jgi:hypothetical protein
MQLYEIEALMENLWMKDKESWEQTRTISYITAQCQSTKPLDMKQMMTFPWEKEQTEKVEDTQEERDAIMKEMKEWEKIMNKK